MHVVQRGFAYVILGGQGQALGLVNVAKLLGTGGKLAQLGQYGNRLLLLQETLGLAFKSKASLVQIATWNDYGEGTIIEPTVEFGYRYLESLQKHKTRKSGKTFQHTANDLRLPLMLYTVRKQAGSDRKVLADLDTISDLLFASKCNEAKALIAKYQGRIDKPSTAGNVLTTTPEE